MCGHKIKAVPVCGTESTAARARLQRKTWEKRGTVWMQLIVNDCISVSCSLRVRLELPGVSQMKTYAGRPFL